MKILKKITALLLSAVVLVTSLTAMTFTASAADDYAAPVVDVIEADGKVKIKVTLPFKELIDRQEINARYGKSKLYFSLTFGDYKAELWFSSSSRVYTYIVNGASRMETNQITADAKFITGGKYFSITYPEGHKCADAISNADKYILEYYLLSDNRYIYGDDKEHIYYKGGVRDIADLKINEIDDLVYTGKSRKPTVKIYDGDKRLSKGTDYTVSYKNNKKIGKATITIKGKGDYTGTVKLNFNIVPEATTLTVTKKSEKKVRCQWEPVVNVDGYQIYYSVNGGKYKKMGDISADKKSIIIKKNSFDFEKNTYKFKIRSYVEKDGEKIYSPFSTAVKAK